MKKLNSFLPGFLRKDTGEIQENTGPDIQTRAMILFLGIFLLYGGSIYTIFQFVMEPNLPLRNYEQDPCGIIGILGGILLISKVNLGRFFSEFFLFSFILKSIINLISRLWPHNDFLFQLISSQILEPFLPKGIIIFKVSALADLAHILLGAFFLYFLTQKRTVEFFQPQKV